jgi:adenine phosphoribosyltransferase
VASAQLVEQLGGVVAGLAFVVELTFLNGRQRLGQYDVLSLLRYDQ